MSGRAEPVDCARVAEDWPDKGSWPSSEHGPVNSASLGASAPSDADRPTATPGADYLRAAEALLPRWLAIMGPTPWLTAEPSRRAMSSDDPALLHRTQAATLAAAMLAEWRASRKDGEYVRACVRASLIRWQFSLRFDGQPANRRQRHSGLCGPTLLYVIQLVNRTRGFQTPMLLADVDRHARWLSRRPAPAPWMEAATVCAIAECGEITGQADFLRSARRRLGVLLAAQHEEGWFPHGTGRPTGVDRRLAPRDGPDLGSHCLTLDALARLYRSQQWAELTVPLQRSLSLLEHLVHPDGSVGGCYGAGGVEFVTPWGVELLATVMETAPSLAMAFRRRYRTVGPDLPGGTRRVLTDWPCRLNDHQAAVLGAGLMLAASTARPLPPNVAGGRKDDERVTAVPGCGLVIVSTTSYYAVVDGRRGGAMRATWRNGGGWTGDAGVTVTGRGPIRTTRNFDPDGRVRLLARPPEDAVRACVTCKAVLTGRRRFSWRGLSRCTSEVQRLVKLLDMLQRFVFGGRSGHAAPSRAVHHRWKNARQPTGHPCERVVHFGQDWIEIRDRVAVLGAGDTIVLHASALDALGPFAGGVPSTLPAEAPLYVDAGSSQEIVRVFRQGRLTDVQVLPYSVSRKKKPARRLERRKTPAVRYLCASKP